MDGGRYDKGNKRTQENRTIVQTKSCEDKKGKKKVKINK